MILTLFLFIQCITLPVIRSSIFNDGPPRPAKIVSRPTPKTIKPGTNVTLTCEAKGSPIPSIVWLKDGQPLPSDKRIRHHEDLYESSVYISDVRDTDNGYYECKAINSNGDDSMTTVISVEGPPYINLQPKDTVGITGSDILVRCEATAYPRPSIEWHRNENPLNQLDPKKYQKLAEGLLIKNANSLDGGSFMCLARNRFGTKSADPVQVTVYNVPQIIHTLPPTTNVTAGKTSLLLQCGITKDYASYQWFKNGIPLLAVFYDDNITPRIEVRKGTGLYFYSVLPVDQGAYSCNVSNPAASTSASGHLFVDVIPSISYITSNFQVREYETFWLNCVYQGMPTPSLQWTHNNAPIHREHTIMANGTLRITSATRFDSGSYQCIVSNRQGTKKKDTIVTVRSKARIEHFPAIQYPITGQKSTITCEVSGYPYPTVDWERNGVRIETYNNDGYVKSGSNLIILNPDRREHDGLYACTARNDYGTDSQMSNVEVLDAPEITRVSGCGPVKQGLECKMTCEATGNPLPTLTWRFKNGNQTRVVKSDNRRYFISLLDSKTKVRTVAFTIKNLRAEDSNLYFCHAENPAGIASKPYELSVRYPARITAPPLLNYQIPIGSMLTISCVAEGEPSPAITWTRDSGDLPPNGRSRIDNDGSLIILNIAREDEGTYTCIADNNFDNADFEFSKDSRTTTVKVTDNVTPLGVMDNPVETWLIVVICICVFVVCLVVFFSVKMIRDRAREKRSYNPSSSTTLTKQPDHEATYQFETLRSKPVTFSVPVDTSNALPMYGVRTGNSSTWSPRGEPHVQHKANLNNSNIDMQLDDVDKQLTNLLKDVDNLRLDNYESDI